MILFEQKFQNRRAFLKHIKIGKMLLQVQRFQFDTLHRHANIDA